MPEQINVPGLGPTRKSTLYLILAAAGGIVIFAWWNARSATAPSIEDEFVEVPDEELPAGPGSVSSGGGQTDTGTVFIDTNPEWSTAVVDALGEDHPYSTALVLRALGKFFARSPLLPEEREVIQAAIATFGDPPNGGPWSIIDASPQPGPSTPPSGKPAKPAALTVQKISNSQWLLVWTPVIGASSYELRSIAGHVGGPLRNTVVPTYMARVSQRANHLAFEVRAKNEAGTSDWIRRTVIGK
jgi:hypothetical protein